MIRTGPPARRTGGERGFSLVEVMLTLLVFTVGSLGLLRLMYSSAEGVTVGSKITTAATLTRNKLDELVKLPYTDTNLSVGSPHNDGSSNLGPRGTALTPAGVATGAFGAHDGWFARSWVVTQDSSGAFKMIVVTTQWWDPVARTMRQYSAMGGKSVQ